MESWISSITQCLQMLPLFCLCSESKPCRNYYLNKTMIKSDTHSSVERERDYKHGVGGIGSGESFRDEDSRCWALSYGAVLFSRPSCEPGESAITSTSEALAAPRLRLPACLPACTGLFFFFFWSANTAGGGGRGGLDGRGGDTRTPGLGQQHQAPSSLMRAPLGTPLGHTPLPFRCGGHRGQTLPAAGAPCLLRQELKRGRRKQNVVSARLLEWNVFSVWWCLECFMEGQVDLDQCTVS